MRTAHPALNKRSFSGFDMARCEESLTMTLQGTVLKAGVLLALCVAGATFGGAPFLQGRRAATPWAIGAGLGGLVLAVTVIVRPRTAAYLAPVFSFVEGAFLGILSARFEDFQHGIVPQAVCLTLGTLLVLLTAYLTGLIRPSEKIKLGIVAATGAIGVAYLVSLTFRFRGHRIPFLHEGGPIGIGLSLFVVVIAALNLVLDFDFIADGVERGAPRYMEWYAAFGLLVTLVWLYPEFVRLLSKPASSHQN